jgi:SOS-response transcriptional repressor LexA
LKNPTTLLSCSQIVIYTQFDLAGQGNMKIEENVNLEDCLNRLKLHYGINTDKELAQMLGMTAANLSNYKNGKGRSFPYKWIISMANKTGRSIDWVLYGSMDFELTRGCIQENYNFPRKIPIVSMGKAGELGEVIDTVTTWRTDEFILFAEPCGPNTFALKVEGDLMEPRFRVGEIIIFDPSIAVKSGDFVLVKDGEDAVFKQLVIDGRSVFLKPVNPRYPIKDMVGLKYKIIGKAIFKQEKL